ncbi:MAG TPA: cytochrome c3 family protein [Thermoanaerobaculia bacterium]|nr:cytochrome c3 family protein [Thermoanaerobaculia bacterium]
MRSRRIEAAALALALGAAACGGEAGYRTLTFFFDGVPPPGGGAAAGPRGRGSGPAGAGAAFVVEHGPYAAKLCDACHEPGRANVLVVPGDQLCGRCHVLGTGKKYVHGPLNAGGCLVCHDPHASPNPYLLVSVTGESCLRCHDRGDLGDTAGHAAGGPPCTTCHEAHMSDKPNLLK